MCNKTVRLLIIIIAYVFYRCVAIGEVHSYNSSPMFHHGLISLAIRDVNLSS